MSIAQFPEYQPDIVEVTSMAEVNDLITWLEGEGKKEYSGVVLDTISEYQMVLAEEILQAALAENIRLGKVNKQTGLPLHSTDALELRDWQPVLVKMWRHIRKLQHLAENMVVVCTAQVGESADPRSPSEMIAGPALRGAWRDMIGAYFGLVAYLSPISFAPNYRNRLYCQPSGQFHAKSRYAIGQYVDSPTIGAILEKMGIQSPTQTQVERS